MYIIWKFVNWYDNFIKILLGKFVGYKVFVYTGKGIINVKIFYKLNIFIEWEIKNKYYWDILIISGRKLSLANIKVVKLIKDFFFCIKSIFYL